MLSIAGSDSGGGAGIQADIKTITMLGCYAATCITSVTAQNTTGVYGTWNLAPEAVEKQVVAVLSDIKIDSIKIGMLPPSLMETVARLIPVGIPVVLDPVMVATSGFELVEATEFMKCSGALLKKVSLLTPNIPEAEHISGVKISTKQDAIKAGEAIKALGVGGVLVKGGHSDEEYVEDILLTDSSVLCFKNARIPGKIHGTGCTLSSAIASFIACGLSTEESVESAIGYLTNTMRAAPKIGHGYNPVFHNYELFPDANTP
ncbi:phosphomethylpyrimidine kinase [Anaplasma marginale str. Dawn]|uniref:bifunctional hydroxymethylpyrimidine kinase/phosphomethylpyrimidine kinase n=1 Tax=Anaplasma marginale TaxID=770 RepID=UPI0003C26AE3|nr:bifunctional hydroxymethylpyrimidine kinase/phosphomethylpyrimidine kinase [Anaplasma marginale]AGZ78662.1 phosphomethylpyrimidine kinase [Anaplasma marginale str. Gypsy Plains]AGZ79509.1 phosphomethylpyrimidine kinase [Anaplasma marginale str. Dawn]KAB0452256.1 bifunctional hydroxymethylpyrimidine kinase/phosphomethylpyrimidine kinase [Anaplasma marginale]RCL19666.1 bifunctional hydroxymethylpyrimidine kinase/phosphomethylpyrimidine kinase [Anaplasma marginale]TZF79342.1 bifunctional hydro